MYLTDILYVRERDYNGLRPWGAGPGLLLIWMMIIQVTIQTTEV